MHTHVQQCITANLHDICMQYMTGFKEMGRQHAFCKLCCCLLKCEIVHGCNSFLQAAEHLLVLMAVTPSQQHSVEQQKQKQECSSEQDLNPCTQALHPSLRQSGPIKRPHRAKRMPGHQQHTSKQHTSTQQDKHAKAAHLVSCQSIELHIWHGVVD